MMGYDDLAMQRTKERYRTMIDDEFPTLWEFWDKNAGTRNHAWTGGPLTMMYMFNAGITPLEAAYKGIQIRPQTAGLKDIKASVPSPNGEISTAVKEEAGSIRLQVSIPEGADYAVAVSYTHLSPHRWDRLSRCVKRWNAPQKRQLCIRALMTILSLIHI